VVERTFSKLEDNRAFAMRTDKRGYIFAGAVAVAALRIWLRDLTRRDPTDTPQRPRRLVSCSDAAPPPPSWLRL